MPRAIRDRIESARRGPRVSASERSLQKGDSNACCDLTPSNSSADTCAMSSLRGCIPCVTSGFAILPAKRTGNASSSSPGCLSCWSSNRPRPLLSKRPPLGFAPAAQSRCGSTQRSAEWDSGCAAWRTIHEPDLVPTHFARQRHVLSGLGARHFALAPEAPLPICPTRASPDRSPSLIRDRWRPLRTPI
jgi:hypothetical protein